MVALRPAQSDHLGHPVKIYLSKYEQIRSPRGDMGRIIFFHIVCMDNFPCERINVRANE